MEWIDGFFARVYSWNHRYFVEFIGIAICAVLLHVGYGVLTDRQIERARQRERLDGGPALSINIGNITNSGNGSSTQVMQQSSEHK